jgi:hypothetical protein
MYRRRKGEGYFEGLQDVEGTSIEVERVNWECGDLLAIGNYLDRILTWCGIVQLPNQRFGWTNTRR